jgi:serine/threonine protein kinase/formylglycine-generating enzyme required for sulfatase activity
MSDQSQHSPRADPRVQAALGEYLERIDLGEVVNRDEFLARHSEIADALRSFFSAEEPLRKIAATKMSNESAAISTQSIAAQGQETVLPKLQPGRSLGTSGSGLAGKFGRYEILRALGKGAMGAVYLAQDTQLKRQVAIKTPHLEEDPTGELLKRFYREAEAAATLRHANICPVHDVGQIDGKHFISMAYIEGRPLSDLIKNGKLRNERHVLIAVYKLARALQQAHDRGIVHRDLKPANIMVDKQGEPMIMDFGLARKRRAEGEASLTQSGVIMGSPAYMSPEQIEGDPESVGPASDQYSLGVVLYEMLTGQLPFRGSVVNVLAQIITKGPAPPGELRPGLDPRIEAVCLRMMAKKSRDRFPTMKAVADQLAAIVKNPASAPAAAETSPTASLPTVVPRAMSTDAEASEFWQSLDQRSLSQRSINPSDVASIEDLVRKYLSRGDYDQMIQIIERIPEDRRSTALQTLLEQAREKVDEIAFLICEINEADRLGAKQTALRKAEELLKIKPGHHRAHQIQQKYSGHGVGAAVRIGRLSQFTRPWNEGGWIPWSVLAFGLAVFAGMYGVIVISLGNKTAIVIDAKDPGITVEVNDRHATIKVPGEQSIRVEPGDQSVKVSYAGLETQTKRFTLATGKTKRLTVRLLDNKLLADLEGEIALPGPAPEPKIAPTVAPTPKSTATRPSAFTNSLDMEFVLVPKGKSRLGGGGGTPGEQEVVIAHDFYLGTYEVTQEEWEKVMDLNPSNFQREGRGRESVANVDDRELKRFPVENVSWDDGQLFLEALNKRENATGWFYRLPKEAEWEYACRGGPTTNQSDTSFDFYFDKPTNQLLPEQAKIQNTLRRTCKVGSYQPNRLGLYDMHGNVWEWCDDTARDADRSERRVLRGGCWDNTPLECRSTAFITRPSGLRWISHGFRIARVPVGTEVAPGKGALTVGRDTASKGSVAETPIEATGGFVSLFNGKDLTGWKTNPDQPDNWRVENGILTGSGERVSDLFTTREDFKAFHLRVEARINDGGNSGVFFRVQPNSAGRYEARINSTKRDPNKTGSLDPPANNVIVAYGDSIVSPGEWFNMEVIAVENHFVITVNGTTTVDYWDSDRHFASGAIGLQLHNPRTVVEFRKIEIKELPAASVTEAPAATTDGFEQLFNGTDLTGWKTHPSQPGNWRVENCVLIGSGPPEKSHLYTERGDFRNFHLRVEARINDGGNSGLYFRSRFGPAWPADRPTWPSGFEAQIDNTTPRIRTGSLYAGAAGVVVCYSENLVPAGQWFVEEVIAEGNRLTIKVNGQTTALYLDEKRISARGHIALQQNNSRTIAEFRKIEIKELSPQDSSAPVSNKVATSTPADARDPFHPTSVWVNDKNAGSVLTVTERKGANFRARFDIGTNISRMIKGTVKDGKVDWFAKDVRAIRGKVGGDNHGTITSDDLGDKIDFVWEVQGEQKGEFTLRPRN